VNPGGEPERDDTGLPPVEIEIPDDARELDPDVQAYYREQRAQRRQQRAQRRLRLHGSLARDGILLPLLACCLILALITGTLLTVFTATSDQSLSGLPGSGTTPARQQAAGGSKSGGGTSGAASPSRSSPVAGAAGSAASAGPGTAPVTLPGALPVAATITAAGRSPIAVQTLRGAMLVLIPAQCDCSVTLSWLVGVAAGAHATTYLVYVPATRAEAQQLYSGLDSTHRLQAVLAQETGGSLQQSGPAGHLAGGLTAILLGQSKGTATYATGLSPQDDPTTLIQALTH